MKTKKKRKNKILYGIFGLVILGGLFYLAYAKGIINFKKEEKPKGEKPPIVEKTLQIIDENSKTRPYAVMINNHGAARAHHTGLQDAYIIYELIVEGGITRYLALFKDQDTTKIGSVRSARHYFLDYALENDAIYVHWGWSPQAQTDIKTLKINNINGLTYEGKYFYRDRSLGVASEHTGFTKMEMLDEAVTKLKYNRDVKGSTLLNYSIDEVDLSTIEDAKEATKVVIKYSNSLTDKYEYDATNKVYKRFVNNKVHKDDITGDQYTFKNVITYQIKNSLISGDEKGRQDFKNIGNGEGYYISNGYAVPITWSKDSRSAQTIYKYKNGKEIDVNDGNTFIQIQPLNQTLEIN